MAGQLGRYIEYYAESNDKSRIAIEKRFWAKLGKITRRISVVCRRLLNLTSYPGLQDMFPKNSSVPEVANDSTQLSPADKMIREDEKNKFSRVSVKLTRVRLYFICYRIVRALFVFVRWGGGEGRARNLKRFGENKNCNKCARRPYNYYYYNHA